MTLMNAENAKKAGFFTTPATDRRFPMLVFYPRGSALSAVPRSLTLDWELYLDEYRRFMSMFRSY